MRQHIVQRWAWLHTWSSLICTAFMLLLCLTGLPLIFSHEIEDAFGHKIDTPKRAHTGAMASMDSLLQQARRQHPDLVPLYLYQDDDAPLQWIIRMATSANATKDYTHVVLDARTAEILGEPPVQQGLMHVFYQLHVDLFAGLPGMVFLGCMGVLFVLALVSGVVLYAPFMRRLPFAHIRRQKGQQLKHLDRHNFLGITTLAWALVVGGTGVINAWGELLVKYWQVDQMAAMIAPYQSLTPPKNWGSLQQAVHVAKALEPTMTLGFVAFPGTPYASPHHFAIFMRGNRPVTKRLFKPVLVDAQTATLTDSRTLPWYLTTLLISQPLHFGDYAGLPLKILWCVLDVWTIVVLWSGLVLWWKKRHQPVPAGLARKA